jgi:hypothetical protein
VPYLWFPTINSTLSFKTGGGTGGGGAAALPANPPVGVTVGPNSYLSNLNFAFLGYFEARKSHWSVFADFMTVSATDQFSSVSTFDVGQGPVHLDPSVNTNTTSSISMTLGTLAGSYTVLHHDRSTLDVFAGVQLVSATTSVNWTLTEPRGLFPRAGRPVPRIRVWPGWPGSTETFSWDRGDGSFRTTSTAGAAGLPLIRRWPGSRAPFRGATSL